MIVLVWPLTILAITALVAAAALRAWSGWLSLKRSALAAESDMFERPTAHRIELAALKDRVRKLEEIAQGVDL